MRSIPRARWATCALTLSICLPALASPPKKSLATCASFDQRDKGDATVELAIKNACTIPVDCAISWRVVCAPQAKKRRAVHPSSAKVSLPSGSEHLEIASAAVCGDDGWSIDRVEWSCAANND